MKRFGRSLLNFALIVGGVFSAAFGLKGFLLSSRFIDGGVTGVSMLLSDIFHAPLSILILVINLPFVAIGYRQIGRAFAIKSVLRSEEHTSELQSQSNLVCRLLLE